LRDAKTRQVLYVNPAFQEVTGRTPESFYENRDTMMDAIHLDDKEWVIQALDQRSEGIPFDREHRIIHLDGSVRWVSSRIFPVRNEAGEVYRWVASMEDVTERKLAENALRESEEKYRLLYEHAGVGIGYYKPDGEIISYNQLAASHMGGKPEDFKGKSIYEVFPGEEAEFYMGRIRKSLESESALEYEDYLALPSGDKWFISVFTRICDAQQNVIGVQIISQDITGQKQAEKALREGERRLVAAQHMAHVGYWERDFDTNRVALSDEACRIFGISEQGLSLTLDQWHPRWVALIHPEDQPRLIELLGEVLAGVRSYDVEYRVIRPDKKGCSGSASQHAGHDARHHREERNRTGSACKREPFPCPERKRIRRHLHHPGWAPELCQFDPGRNIRLYSGRADRCRACACHSSR
jgi:PAS domain S-box-containing protein